MSTHKLEDFKVGMKVRVNNSYPTKQAHGKISTIISIAELKPFPITTETIEKKKRFL